MKIYQITFSDKTVGLVFDYGEVEHKPSQDKPAVVYRLFSPYTDNRAKHWILKEDIGKTVFLTEIFMEWK